MVKLAWLAAGALPFATLANPLVSRPDVTNGSYVVSIARNNVQAATPLSHLPQSTPKVLSHVAVPVKDSEPVNATLFGHASDATSPVKHQVLVAVLPLASTTVTASTTVSGPLTGTLDALSVLCAAMATPPTYCQAVPSATATSATESTAAPVSSGASSGAASSAQATTTTTASIVSGPTSGASTATSETSRRASSTATTAAPSSTAASSSASNSASSTDSSSSGSSVGAQSTSAAATSATSTASSTLSTTTSSATAAGTVVPPVPAVAGSTAVATVPLFVTWCSAFVLGAMLLL
ncbi:uncharacterized protein K452DRAFT_357616 [Aplosporella prunicola CBS 121167]|uniref:Uncharacterized protein n=1 Tax=Aplosporella prunicola CBS 121167 TaxID=1176127 RepID=A0A6A6BL07_9PEZI|nr:uncharacterized protein K452DRAFT_357616 [Aplosporella prunicola CBS 121167]KAF2143261.1 hypothetical protein K452DRAFT_357616 [Aplosporella prunicola CBS 121167]